MMHLNAGQLAQMRQEEMRREAENARLVRETSTSSERSNVLHGLMAEVGRQMVSTGQKLQDRHGQVPRLQTES
ncbi:MAG: hypothetical protein SF029_19825 [bacterium]|nr:hypothetical protein [bacterium]